MSTNSERTTAHAELVGRRYARWMRSHYPSVMKAFGGAPNPYLSQAQFDELFVSQYGNALSKFNPCHVSRALKKWEESAFDEPPTFYQILELCRTEASGLPFDLPGLI